MSEFLDFSQVFLYLNVNQTFLKLEGFMKVHKTNPLMRRPFKVNNMAVKDGGNLKTIGVDWRG